MARRVSAVLAFWVYACSFPKIGPHGVWQAGGHAMPGNPLRVGDRVNMEGREDVFFVLHVDLEAGTASLLPSDNGPVLKEIPMGSLKALPVAGSNGAASV